jgi:type II secretory pathway pseudopilin PulG
MRIRHSTPPQTKLHQLAYTLVEVAIGVAIVGITFVSLYAGMSGGFAVTQLSRENLRATQIILERMEGVRLYNWDQLTTSNALYPGYLPTTFTNYYYPLATNGESKGIAYAGSMVITNADLTPYATYGGNMRKVSVTVNWESGGVPRSRTMTTYQSRNGMQNYVYNN